MSKAWTPKLPSVAASLYKLRVYYFELGSDQGMGKSAWLEHERMLMEFLLLLCSSTRSSLIANLAYKHSDAAPRFVLLTCLVQWCHQDLKALCHAGSKWRLLI